MTTPTWTVTHGRIPEVVVPGHRLGRNIRHDSRSLNYRHQRTATALVTVTHERRIPILNQGGAGACTGNAETGALGTEPLYSALPRPHPHLSEGFALGLYSAAETLDGDGPYPPNDNGSSGLSVCQAARNAGLIAGYTHCLGVPDVLDALQTGPVILGIDWYTSFDTPGPITGIIAITPGATVRGGHEILARGIDITAQTILCDNSWGTSWGLNGSMTMTWDTLAELLAAQGDATVNVPLTSRTRNRSAAGASVPRRSPGSPPKPSRRRSTRPASAAPNSPGKQLHSMPCIPVSRGNAGSPLSTRQLSQ